MLCMLYSYSGFFYQFSLLGDGTRFLYVVENKSFAGRMAVSEGEASGRFLAVVWYSKEESAMEGIIVSPEASKEILEVRLYTLAELSRAAGFYPPTDGLNTRQVDILHEQLSLIHI